MSADAWRVCPQCLVNYNAETELLQKRLADTYGKVDKDQFVLMAQMVSQRDDEEFMEEHLGETLREDREAWMDENGTFTVNYRCTCSKCEFHHEYQYIEQLKFTANVKNVAKAQVMKKAIK